MKQQMGQGTWDKGHVGSKLLRTLKGKERLAVCEIQSDFGLKAKANIMPNKGNPVKVDSDERAEMPIKDAKDAVQCTPFRSVIGDQTHFHHLVNAAKSSLQVTSVVNEVRRQKLNDAAPLNSSKSAKVAAEPVSKSATASQLAGAFRKRQRTVG